jgi:hypothetical protein
MLKIIETHPSNPKRSNAIPIFPPSPKVTNAIPVIIESVESIKSVERVCVQPASAIFDPNNASPVNEFISNLKLRMSVYYDPSN